MFIDLLHRFVRQRFSRLGIRSKFLEDEHCLIHYYENRNGASKTLILLHGLGTSSSTWANVLPHIANTFRVIAVDLPGFGFSTWKTGEECLSIERFHDVLARTLPQIARPPFALIGHSLGGWLAMDYAIRSPDLVRQIVLINPAGVRYPGIEEQRRLFEITNLRSLYILLNRLWMKYPWYFKPFAAAILHDLKRRKVPEFVRSILETDFVNERLASLKTPAHLIWGNNDAVLRVETVQILKNALPEIKVSFIEQCGHVPQLERPRELIRILDEIL